MTQEQTMRGILEYVYSCDVRSDQLDKNRIINEARASLKSLIGREVIPKETSDKRAGAADEPLYPIQFGNTYIAGSEGDAVIWNGCIAEARKKLEEI